jgi:hypothetical protein
VGSEQRDLNALVVVQLVAFRSTRAESMGLRNAERPGSPHVGWERSVAAAECADRYGCNERVSADGRSGKVSVCFRAVLYDASVRVDVPVPRKRSDTSFNMSGRRCRRSTATAEEPTGPHAGQRAECLPQGGCLLSAFDPHRPSNR